MASFGPVSVVRRGAMAAAALLLAVAPAAAGGAVPPLRAYVGTYTGPPRPPGAETAGDRAHGEGIYLVDVDPATGALARPRLAAATPSPSWLAIDAARGLLYAANEVAAGTVSAFRIAPATGALTPIGSQPTGGAPVYVALAGGGAYLLAANYGGGSVAVLPLRPDGSPAPATEVRSVLAGMPAQSPSPTHHAGDGAAAVHMAAPDRQDRFVLANDSVGDRLFAWRLDRATGRLVTNDPPFFAVPRGAFPRHFVLSPDNRHLYDLDERDDMISVFDLATRRGNLRLTLAQRAATLSPAFTGRAQGSELLISRDGRFLYAGLRGRDTIAAFAAARDGRLTLLGETAIGGGNPRTLAFDPAERFLFALNLRSDTITVFRRDVASGRLAPAAVPPLAIAGPAAMVFVP